MNCIGIKARPALNCHVEKPGAGFGTSWRLCFVDGRTSRDPRRFSSLKKCQCLAKPVFPPRPCFEPSER